MFELTSGWVLPGIILLSLAAWVLIVWKWLRLRRDAKKGLGWAERVVACVRADRLADAIEICRGHADLIGRFVLRGLEQRDPGRFLDRQQIDPEQRAELSAQRRHHTRHARKATHAPRLGLL